MMRKETGKQLGLTMLASLVLVAAAAESHVDLVLHDGTAGQQGVRWSRLDRTGAATGKLGAGTVYLVANETQGYYYLQYTQNGTYDDPSADKEVFEVSNAGQGLTVVSAAALIAALHLLSASC